MIQTRGLTKSFRHPLFPWKVRVEAVKGLTLRIESGEVFGLLGPNGSGKSTTIKLILGLNHPTSGEVSVFGRRPDDLFVKRRVGYLPEESYLYPFLNPEEILDFYARLFELGRKERRRRVEGLLEFVGLREERRRPIGEFSKGMQRRVALAQSLINDPEVVIMDEPTTGMDPIGIAEIKSLIRHLKEKRKTVVMCSHRLKDVEDVCDRVMILYGGEEQASGVIEEIVPAGEGLEGFFLRVVKEAQEKNVPTSGVSATTGKGLEFLTEVRE